MQSYDINAVCVPGVAIAAIIICNISICHYLSVIWSSPHLWLYSPNCCHKVLGRCHLWFHSCECLLFGPHLTKGLSVSQCESSFSPLDMWSILWSLSWCLEWMQTPCSSKVNPHANGTRCHTWGGNMGCLSSGNNREPDISESGHVKRCLWVECSDGRLLPDSQLLLRMDLCSKGHFIT